MNYINKCLVHRRHHGSTHRSGVLIHLNDHDMPMQMTCLGGEDQARPLVISQQDVDAVRSYVDVRKLIFRRWGRCEGMRLPEMQARLVGLLLLDKEHGPHEGAWYFLDVHAKLLGHGLQGMLLTDAPDVYWDISTMGGEAAAVMRVTTEHGNEEPVHLSNNVDILVRILFPYAFPVSAIVSTSSRGDAICNYWLDTFLERALRGQLFAKYRQADGSVRLYKADPKTPCVTVPMLESKTGEPLTAVNLVDWFFRDYAGHKEREAWKSLGDKRRGVVKPLEDFESSLPTLVHRAGLRALP